MDTVRVANQAIRDIACTQHTIIQNMSNHKSHAAVPEPPHNRQQPPPTRRRDAMLTAAAESAQPPPATAADSLVNRHPTKVSTATRPQHAHSGAFSQHRPEDRWHGAAQWRPGEPLATAGRCRHSKTVPATLRQARRRHAAGGLSRARCCVYGNSTGACGFLTHLQSRSRPAG